MNSAQESSYYHDMTRRGFFAILVDGKQSSHRLSELETVLSAAPTDADVWLGQGEFFSPCRRLTQLARIGLCFSDCETHKSRYSYLTPEQQAQTLLLHCEDTGAPRPSLINYSGRGIHPKWIFDTPIPAQALPRWNAVQRALGEMLKDFAPDRAARDGSRCLRAIGSVNPRSGQRARVVYPENTDGKITTWDFETLCREVLPIDRAVLQAKKQASIRPDAAQTLPRKCNLWQPKQLWWNRLADVRRLIELRGWTEGVPVGSRHNFLFVAACAAAWGAEPANLSAEIAELAREFCPSLPAPEVRAVTSSVLAKAKAGERLKFSSARLIEYLDIQQNEQTHLRAICDPDERKRRKQKRDRENARKHCDRETYEANAAARRRQAQSLRADGHSYAGIAERMGVTINAVDKLLRVRVLPTL